jgi:hypothetical protein
VITVNDFRLLTDGLQHAGDIDHGLMLLRNCASLPLRALVAEQLRVSWEVFDEHARAPPPRFLGNALLLAAVRDLEARGDLRVVPPDSPLLKKGRLLGQVGAQGGGGGEGFAVPPHTFFAVPPQPLAIPDSARGTGEPPSWIGEVVRASVESALKGFGPGSGFGGGGDDTKEGHLAAVKRAKLENLIVGQPLAESVAAAQLTLQRLANAATQECKQAMSADKTFDHAHGLQASLHTVRDQALAKSAYGSKSRSTTFEAFGDYMNLVFKILALAAAFKGNEAAATLHRQQAISFPEGWRALVARVEQENWAGSNSLAALSVFVRVVMGDQPTEAERKDWTTAGMSAFIAPRPVTAPAALAEQQNLGSLTAKAEGSQRVARTVGLWFPDAADLVGPLGKVKSTSCNYCHQVGHDKFECPVLFGITFHQAMPGHTLEGVKLPQYWHADDPQNGPAKSVAKGWIEQVWCPSQPLSGRDVLRRTTLGTDAWGAWANGSCARPLQ